MTYFRYLAAVVGVLAAAAAWADEPITNKREVDPRTLDKMLGACSDVGEDGRRLAHLRVDMLRAVNEQRWNLRSLQPDRKLDDAAQAHALDMASGGFMDHAGSDGSDVGTRARQYGYEYGLIMENVAQGQTSVEDVVADWMTSPGHRSAILHKDGVHLGVGFATGRHQGRRGDGMTPGCFWVMVVGKPLYY